jgi:hypothetical protein
MKQNRLPKGWDEDRVKRILEHYERQTDTEAVAQDELAEKINREVQEFEIAVMR